MSVKRRTSLYSLTAPTRDSHLATWTRMPGHAATSPSADLNSSLHSPSAKTLDSTVGSQPLFGHRSNVSLFYIFILI